MKGEYSRLRKTMATIDKPQAYTVFILAALGLLGTALGVSIIKWSAVTAQQQQAAKQFIDLQPGDRMVITIAGSPTLACEVLE